MGKIGVLESILLTYPGLFLVSSFVYPLTHKYAEDVGDNGIVFFLNAVFVEKYGYLWFTLIYLSYVLLYTNETLRIPQKYIIEYMGTFLLNTTLFVSLNHWFLGESLYDRLDKVLGGHCLLDNRLTKIECSQRMGVWEGGFNASGHSYLLISMSFLLWKEVAKQLPVSSYYMYKYRRLHSDEYGNIGTRKSQEGALKKVRYILLCMSFFLIFIWWFMYLITCLFFHTFLEKMVGILLGASVPSLTMYIFPNQET